MKKEIRWAVLGTGPVVNEFVSALGQVDNARLVAVGSSSAERAAQFADNRNQSLVTGSFEDILKLDSFDVVYIGTRTDSHADLAKLALTHGHAVVCEKPLVTNAMHAQELGQLASRSNLFLMEAMWARFTPGNKWVKALIESGALGEIEHIEATYGHRADPASIETRLAPGEGAGVILDLGSYLVSLVHYFAGEIVEAQCVARKTSEGVDTHSSFVLKGRAGFTANCAVSFDTTLPTALTLYGSHGRCEIGHPVYNPAWATFTSNAAPKKVPSWIPAQEISNRVFSKLQRTCDPFLDRFVRRESFPVGQHGFVHQIIHVQDCLEQASDQSPVLPVEDSIHCLQILDQLRERP